MSTTRRGVIGAMLASTGISAQTSGANVTRFVRFRAGSITSYGIVQGDTVRAIRGDLFGAHEPTSVQHKLAQVKLLCPCEPPKVLAVGLNYKSHLRDRKPPANPEMFYKPLTSLQHPGDNIEIPADSKNTHYEGELVVVIGKRTSNVSREEARAAIFGVTCGNDVSERDWQNGANKDLQWWRAKGADTFGPFGPMIVRGLDYGNLRLETRVNGKVVQKESTSDLLFDVPAIVSFTSKYVTLTPGDIIYTGTPDTTTALKHGDVVEVEIDKVGVLRNPVVQRSMK